MLQLEKNKKTERYNFYGTFKGYVVTGGRRGYSQHLLFEDVWDEYGNFVAACVRVDDCKVFANLDLEIGDRVVFRARIIEYINTNVYHIHYRYDLSYDMYPRLSYPTKARKLHNPICRPIKEEDYIPHKIQIKYKRN